MTQLPTASNSTKQHRTVVKAPKKVTNKTDGTREERGRDDHFSK
jgi:hypothetical protein